MSNSNQTSCQYKVDNDISIYNTEAVVVEMGLNHITHHNTEEFCRHSEASCNVFSVPM